MKVIIIMLIVLMGCQTVFMVQHDIKYSYTLNGQTIVESECVISYRVEADRLVLELPGHKTRYLTYDDIKILDDIKYKIAL